MGFYTVGKRGTVQRQRFNCRGACKRLYEGMKGFGTNEDAITEVVAGHTVAQRQEIKTKYKIMYGKDLIKELDSELSGAFGKLVLSLMKDPEEYILECIRNAIVKSKGDKLFKKLQKMTNKKRLCADAYSLLGLLLLRNNKHLEEIKKAYKAKYDTELEEDVGEDFADEFRSLIFGIIYAGRDESDHVDMELIQEDIENLQSGGEAGVTREEIFQACFEERSWIHLKQLFTSYKDVTGQAIEGMLEASEVLPDTMKEAYGTVVKIIQSPPDFYAERLRDSIEGLGTDDDTLISTIVLRAEIDLVDIINQYEVLFETSLEDDVVGDTSGDYKNILLKLLTLPEEDDDSEIHHPPVKKVAVEICTQTEEEEEPHVSVNVADEDGHEAVGHEVEVEEPPEEEEEEMEVEEEQVVAVVEEPVEISPPVEEQAEEEKAAEEVVEEVQAEETEESVEVEQVPAEETVANEGEEDEATPAAEEDDKKEEASEEATVAEETEVDASAEVNTEVEENEEKKKAEEADNAEGG